MKGEGETIFQVKGKCGSEIFLLNPKDSHEKKLLIDCSNMKKPHVNYLQKHEASPLESLEVWSEVSKYIVESDMEKADEAKKKIEQEQRERIASRKMSGTEHQSHFFVETEFGWMFKEPTAKVPTLVIDFVLILLCSPKAKDQLMIPVVPLHLTRVFPLNFNFVH